MKKLKYTSIYIIIFSIFLCIGLPINTYAVPVLPDGVDGEQNTNSGQQGITDTGGSNSTDYDGSPLDNPVCDSGYSNSFADAQYYDMAIPYSLTNKEIGGYSTGSYAGSQGAMSITDQKTKVGMRFNRDQDHTGSACYSTVKNCSNITITDNSDGMCVAKDTNGTEYYLLALPLYFYNSSTEIQWGLENRGQIIEIYFTDGKYIRGIIADAKAIGHTNGGEGTEHKPTGQDGDRYKYKFSTLNYEQYQNIYQAEAGEIFEWFCLKSGSNRSNTAALAGSTGSPAFVRMYNLKITDGVPTLNSNESSTATGVKTTNGSNVGSSTQSQSNANGYAGGLFEENYYATEMFLNESNWETEINQISRDNLDVQELEDLSDWELMANQNDTSLISFMRRLVALLGVLLILWGILLYLAYWFDTINTLIPFQFVPMLSFGKLEVLNEEETTFSLAGDRDKTKRVTVNHKNILTVCILLIGAGVFILTGFIYTIIGALYHKIKSFY